MTFLILPTHPSMKRDYLDLGSMRFHNRPAVIIESFSGTAIVGWQGKIERQLVDLINEYEDANNPGYVDKLRALLSNWRANPLTGSINIETLRALIGPIELSAVDPWKLQNYFSQLRDSLKQITASVEELPPGALDGPPPGPEMQHISPPSEGAPPAQDFGQEGPAPGEGGEAGPEANPDEIPPDGATKDGEEELPPQGRRNVTPAV